jgi:hypothetical protein
MDVVFYHRHQNGDTFTSRLFVKHFIEETRGKNYKYFYTSDNSLESKCDDLGIPNENFNAIKAPMIREGIVLHKENNKLFINLWISCSKHDGCIWCLDGYIKHYNDIIDDLKNFDIHINPISEDTVPFLPIERTREYDIDPKYTKIVVYYNCQIKTYQHMNLLDHNTCIASLATKYPDYLFVTFIDSGLPHDNVKSFRQIVKGDLQKGHSVEMANFCKQADKVILLPSGVSQLAFYMDKGIWNKYMILYYLAHPHLIPDNFICEDRYTVNLCIDKYDYHIQKLWLENKTMDTIIAKLDTFIRE